MSSSIIETIIIALFSLAILLLKMHAKKHPGKAVDITVERMENINRKRALKKEKKDMEVKEEQGREKQYRELIDSGLMTKEEYREVQKKHR